MLAAGGDMVESLSVGIRGKANIADLLVGVYYRSPSQDDGTDVLVCKELTPILSPLVALALMGNFSFPDVNWDCHTADLKRSRKYMEPQSILVGRDVQRTVSPISSEKDTENLH